MPILKENKEHQVMPYGESMCEPEHAERCDIQYQLKRVASGLNPNWTNANPIRYGYEKMDNSLTDHRIALKEQLDTVAQQDLTQYSDEQWDQMPHQIRERFTEHRNNQKIRRLNDEKQKLPKTPVNEPDPKTATPPATPPAKASP